MNKLLIVDIDGVMTDGTKTYDVDGEVISKRFCDQDWTGIKKFKMHDWRVCFLSADRTVNEAVAKDREVDFWYSRDDDGTIDKVRWLKYLSNHYFAELNQIIYIGDDVFDLPIMRELIANGGSAYCPADAVPYMDGVAERLERKGGSGALMELFSILYPTDDSQPPH